MIHNEIINTKARILRDRDGKSAIMHVRVPSKWKLYSGPSIKKIDFEKPILEGEGKGSYPLTVSKKYRSYFCIETKRGRAIIADNHLPMTGGFNFRDLGGIPTSSGQHIKWGKLFRADEMSNLTDDDLSYLASIPLRSVIDFRAEGEVRNSPDKLPSTARFLYPISITPGNVSTEGVPANLLHIDMNEYMENLNRLLVTEPESVRAFRSLFSILQNSLSAPLMYHCTAGKDRTGMATALILYALGVDEEIILLDYMTSKKYLKDKYREFIRRHPKTAPMFTVKKAYLEEGLRAIHENYGSVDNFLVNELKVNIPKLRKMYLI